MTENESHAQSTQATPRVVIVQCTNAKRDEPATARDLYDESDYFRKQRAYAKAVAEHWYIQSAKYGLLNPKTRVKPYDKHAGDVEDTEEWAASIARGLAGAVEPPATVELLGGKDYVDPLTPELEARGYDVVEQLLGMRIGTRKRWLMDNTEAVA